LAGVKAQSAAEPGSDTPRFLELPFPASYSGMWESDGVGMADGQRS
jgi:hypothetical protein